MLTLQELSDAITLNYKLPKNIENIHKELVVMFEEYDITTNQQVSYSLAQFIFETAGFNLLQEQDNKSKTYLKAKAYYPYYGRGIIQLTWLGNYILYTRYRQNKGDQVDFAANPDTLLELHNAVDVGGWFWVFNNLNELADNRQFTKSCIVVNGIKCKTVEERRRIMLFIKRLKGWK